MRRVARCRSRPAGRRADADLGKREAGALARKAMSQSERELEPPP